MLVEEVTGVVAIDEERIGPAPAGQAGDVIWGVIALPNALVLLVDPSALARMLVAS